MFKLHAFILNLFIKKKKPKKMLRETGYVRLSELAGLFMALKKIFIQDNILSDKRNRLHKTLWFS